MHKEDLPYFKLLSDNDLEAIHAATLPVMAGATSPVNNGVSEKGDAKHINLKRGEAIWFLQGMAMVQ